MSGILILTRTKTGNIHPYIEEQVIAIRKKCNVKIEYFLIEGNGWNRYFYHRRKLLKIINELHPVLIHAHYGITALLANTQRKIPVVSTYHGSDVNKNIARILSKLTMRLSAWNVFVSSGLQGRANYYKRSSVIPCGVNIKAFYPVEDRDVCRKKLGLSSDRVYILFSKAFFVKVKNYPLAKAAVDMIDNAELIELHGYSRKEVLLLMNACDAGLLTSFSEGSPQFIKEAMACNLPIVSTDVGDIREVIRDTRNCHITSFNAVEISDKLKRILDDGRRSNGREILSKQQLDNKMIAEKIIDVYNNVASFK